MIPLFDIPEIVQHYAPHFAEVFSEEAFLHYSDDQTDYPVDFRLWQPADLARIEAGLRATGVPMRQGKLALKQNDPKKWRQYLVGLWRRKQNRSEVKCLYESKLTLAEAMLGGFVAAYPALKLPVVFDNWYTQPAFCRFIDKRLRWPYVGTLAADDQVELAAGPVTLKAFAEHLKAEHQDRDSLLRAAQQDKALLQRLQGQVPSSMAQPGHGGEAPRRRRSGALP